MRLADDTGQPWMALSSVVPDCVTMVSPPAAWTLRPSSTVWRHGYVQSLRIKIDTDHYADSEARSYFACQLSRVPLSE